MSHPANTHDGCLIQLRADGPMLVQGGAELDGSPLDTGAALCRCGHSANKPYCDGSHKGAGFSDAGTIDTAGVTGTAEDDSALKLKLTPNGPILCSGAMTIQSADGTQSSSGVRAALCRCGASTKKPFCDGTHGKIGFDAG